MTLDEMVEQHGPFIGTAVLAGTVHDVQKAVTRDGRVWISTARLVVDDPGPRHLCELRVLPDDHDRIGTAFNEGAGLLVGGRWNRKITPAPLEVDRVSVRR